MMILQYGDNLLFLTAKKRRIFETWFEAFLFHYLLDRIILGIRKDLMKMNNITNIISLMEENKLGGKNVVY
jgi:hypothetical protein